VEPQDLDQLSVEELKILVRDYYDRESQKTTESRSLAEANVNAALLVSEIQQKNEELRQQFIQLEYEIEQRHLAEQDLDRLNKELEDRVSQRTTDLDDERKKALRAAKDLQDFAYVVSHDLQEPLRMITSYLQLLDRRCSKVLDDEGREFMEFVLDGARRMQQMISDILSFSRVSATGNGFTSVCCEKVIESVLKNLDGVIKESGVVIDVKPLPAVVGDFPQLTRLFQNLIQNAIKFTAPGTQPQLQISVEKGEKIHRFSITDQGIGIDSKHHERIFIMFQRLHTREQFTGSGIGLPICKRIVERHGGKIWVDSEPENGSSFHFTLLPSHQD
jgi:light-regulated signal transduction histidine kinase (bacteriophytochrome)